MADAARKSSPLPHETRNICRIFRELAPTTIFYRKRLGTRPPAGPLACPAWLQRRPKPGRREGRAFGQRQPSARVLASASISWLSPSSVAFTLAFGVLLMIADYARPALTLDSTEAAATPEVAVRACEPHRLAA